MFPHGKAYRLLIAVLFLVTAVMVCKVLLIEFNRLWVDPRDAAVADVRHCLEFARASSSTPTYDQCGRLITGANWDLLEGSVAEAANTFTVSVVWTNWEDGICCRGGDEVMAEVTFSDGEVYRIQWYEGLLEEMFRTPSPIR